MKTMLNINLIVYLYNFNNQSLEKFIKHDFGSYTHMAVTTVNTCNVS